MAEKILEADMVKYTIPEVDLKKDDVYIKIPIYYGVDDDDNIILDIHSMNEEFYFWIKKLTEQYE